MQFVARGGVACEIFQITCFTGTNVQILAPEELCGQSKLCNLLHVEELHARYFHPQKLCAVCIDPGEVLVEYEAFSY